MVQNLARVPNILIVNDSKFQLHFIASLLTRSGFRNNRLAESAVEAFQRMRRDDERNLPDLILLNLFMPDMDGIDACRQIKSTPQLQDIPIIMITSKNDDEQIKRTFDAGATDFLSIPFREAEFIARIKSALQRKYEVEQLNNLNARLKELSYLDSLTGAHNRRFFDEFLKREWRRSARFQRPLSLIMIDIDDFKRYNDRYGHSLGDDCLRNVAEAMRSTLRGNDVFCRYGGEEFVVILPETDRKGVFKAAEKLAQAVRSLQIPHEDSGTSSFVTISAGCCSMVAQSEEGRERLIAIADHALYLAKNKGRNQICFAD